MILSHWVARRFRATLPSLIISFCLVVYLACTHAMASETIEDSFPEVRSNFEEYRSDLRDYLIRRGMPHRTAEDVELNLPFDKMADPNVPYQGRFLLLHGLNDSAYVWQDFASSLVTLGFDVRTILFKGHGSTPKDMLRVSSDHWLKESRRQLDLWWDNNSPMYIGGFSMGAVIASLLALEKPKLAGLLLVSPAFHSKLNKYLRWSGVSKKFKPWVFGGMIWEDNPIKYNSIPVNSGYQYYRLTEKKSWRRNKISVPTLVIASLDDSVVDHNYSRKLFKRRFVHPNNRLVLYGNEEIVQFSEQEINRPSRFPQLRVLNQSHLGLMYKPNNPLFGRNGTVLVCNGNEYPIFMACMRATGHWYGAQHAVSPDGVPVARTTYNADWAFVEEQIQSTFMSTRPSNSSE